MSLAVIRGNQIDDPVFKGVYGSVVPAVAEIKNSIFCTIYESRFEGKLGDADAKTIERCKELKREKNEKENVDKIDNKKESRENVDHPTVRDPILIFFAATAAISMSGSILGFFSTVLTSVWLWTFLMGGYVVKAACRAFGGVNKYSIKVLDSQKHPMTLIAVNVTVVIFLVGMIIKLAAS